MQYGDDWLKYLVRESSGVSLYAPGVIDCPDCCLRIDWCNCSPAATRRRLIDEYLAKRTDDWIDAKQVCGNPIAWCYPQGCGRKTTTLPSLSGLGLQY